MNVMWFEELTKDDVDVAGGKGANLGEMTQAGLPVPPGFVITSKTYEKFLKKTGIFENMMEILGKTDVDNTSELQNASKELRALIESVPIPSDIKKLIVKHYKKLCDSAGNPDEFVAIRSSATAEDLPGASFAGQQETFLNIKGEKDLLESVRKCWSSLFTPRAIFYREEQGFEHSQVLIAVVVQKMVNADKAGVMFSVHPATGEKDQIVIEAAWGLGEGVVSGTVSPDHYVISKKTEEILEEKVATKELMFTKDKETGGTITEKIPANLAKKQVLTKDEIVKLAKLGKLVEDHYNFPQDMEWAIEGKTDPYMLQSRPITVLYDEATEETGSEKGEEVIIKGLGSSPGVGSGPVRIIFELEEIDKVLEGDILVTTMTNPDMVPAMKRANAIVTEEGGMTCHAAIVSRELGIPCIVGTGNCTKVLKDGNIITVDGTRGVVYKGAAKAKKAEDEEVVAAPSKIVTGTEVKVNLSVPDERIAKKMAKMADGVGLLRVEHIILGMGRHPMSFIREGEEDKFIDGLSKDLRIVVDAFYPNGIVYIRTLDAPTDEFKNMKGGEDEPHEPNPMLGWRGVRRGLDEPDLLRAELKAIKRLVEENYRNIGVMIPLVQHPRELRRAKELAMEVGLRPHKDVQFGIMVETPASALIIDDFIKEGLDFISFGTNDLTQYTLALDRNNERVAKHFTEKHPAVLKLIQYVIERCNEAGVDTSICGQAGSDPGVVKKLVEYGITSVSANPDAVLMVRETVKRAETRLLLEKARGG
ncbi:MAG: phosphoenolpyruvate synthase [Candidatus Hydrothermarchaeales archaeon]